MRTPVLRTNASESQTWFARVRENLCQVLTPTRLTASSSNGAPIHLLKLGPSARSGKAQTVSFVTHAAIILALALLATHTRSGGGLTETLIEKLNSGPIFAPLSDTIVSRPSLGRSGGGGDNNPIPARHGLPAPNSSIQLASPHLPDNLNHALPVPVTILDSQAPAIVPTISNLGLPWMPKDTGSAGPGKDGIGNHGRDGMGDDDGPSGGEGIAGRYAAGVTAPICSYCPLPMYTDEARHVKMQGTVTLRVLVSADGKASQVRVVTGVGYGLEERAVQTVNAWKFLPARDAARRPIPAWVTIEVTFRLF
jgi:periplasmic protein TonB